MSLKIIDAPTEEPVTLAEAKAHLRVDGTDDDVYITSLIVAARNGAESLTGRALMLQSWELALDEFKDRIRIPKPPLVSITSVKYVDGNGVLQTMGEADYLLDTHSQPARLTPAYGRVWPSARKQANAVLIRFTAGYVNAAAVPAEIKSWMLLRIGMLYANRESVVVGTALSELPHVDRLLSDYIDWGR